MDQKKEIYEINGRLMTSKKFLDYTPYRKLCYWALRSLPIMRLLYFLAIVSICLALPLMNPNVYFKNPVIVQITDALMIIFSISILPFFLALRAYLWVKFVVEISVKPICY